MNRTLQLQQDREAARTKASAIISLAQTENRNLRPDESAAFDALETEISTIQATLDREARMAAISNIHTDGGNGHQPAQVRLNLLDKPFGPEARNGETAVQRRDRLALGFGEQLRAVRHAAIRPDSVDPRLLELNQRAPAGSSEQVPADGGFLVYPEFSNEVVMIAHDVGLVYTQTRKFPLGDNTNAIKIPGIDEQSRVNGSRWGGVQTFWANEADSLTASKPKFRLIEMVLKKLTGLLYTTDEILVDAPSFGAIAMQAFGEEFAYRMDDAVINGTGQGQPQGILNAPALITIAKETGQAAKTLLYENVKKMYYRLYARGRRNAIWFVNQDVEQQLLSMSQSVGTGGSSVVAGIAPAGPDFFVPGYRNADGRARLLTLPVVPIEQAATLGTVGDIILADLTQYLRIERDMQTATSMHVRFLTDEMTYRFIWRADGQSQWHTALTPANGTNTVSPFLVTATRS